VKLKQEKKREDKINMAKEISPQLLHQ